MTTSRRWAVSKMSLGEAVPPLVSVPLGLVLLHGAGGATRLQVFLSLNCQTAGLAHLPESQSVFAIRPRNSTRRQSA